MEPTLNIAQTWPLLAIGKRRMIQESKMEIPNRVSMLLDFLMFFRKIKLSFIFLRLLTVSN